MVVPITMYRLFVGAVSNIDEWPCYKRRCIEFTPLKLHTPDLVCRHNSPCLRLKFTLFRVTILTFQSACTYSSQERKSIKCVLGFKTKTSVHRYYHGLSTKWGGAHGSGREQCCTKVYAGEDKKVLKSKICSQKRRGSFELLLPSYSPLLLLRACSARTNACRL